LLFANSSISSLRIPWARLDKVAVSAKQCPASTDRRHRAKGSWVVSVCRDGKGEPKGSQCGEMQCDGVKFREEKQKEDLSPDERYHIAGISPRDLRQF